MTHFRKIVASVVVGAIALVIIVHPAKAKEVRWSNQELSRVLSQYANRAVVVDCATIDEDVSLTDAWGYVFVPPEQQGQATIDGRLCMGALAIRSDHPDIPDFYKAMGAAVILHEAYHLRRIRGNTDEALTECRAMRRFDGILKALGASQETTNRLMPLMLLEHWHLLAKYPEYSWPGCNMPKRYDKYRGYPPEV